MERSDIAAGNALVRVARGPIARAARIPWLRRLHDDLATRLRSSEWATRALFGVPPAEPGIIHWDYTSLMVCRTVRPMLRDGLRVWDLGCGPEALATRFVRRLANVDVLASDVDADSVTRARRALADRVPVVRSDLGESVTGVFDLILFNAPYLPLGAPEMLPPGLATGPEARSFRSRLGGGADGFDTMRRLIHQVRPFLAPRGRVLLGWNCFYVPIETVVQEVAAAGHLRIAARSRSWWNPSAVLVLEAA